MTWKYRSIALIRLIAHSARVSFISEMCSPIDCNRKTVARSRLPGSYCQKHTETDVAIEPPLNTHKFDNRKLFNFHHRYSYILKSNLLVWLCPNVHLFTFYLDQFNAFFHSIVHRLSQFQCCIYPGSLLPRHLLWRRIENVPLTVNSIHPADWTLSCTQTRRLFISCGPPTAMHGKHHNDRHKTKYFRYSTYRQFVCAMCIDQIRIENSYTKNVRKSVN